MEIRERSCDNQFPREEMQNVAKITADFERITLEARTENQKFEEQMNLSKNTCDHRSGRRRRPSSKKTGLCKEESFRLGKLLACDSDDATAATTSTDESSYSESFSVSMVFNSSSHNPSQRLNHTFENSLSLLASLPLDKPVEEDESASSDLQYLGCSIREINTRTFPKDIKAWELITILGEGNFGQVHQVSQIESDDERSYALKMLSKAALVDNGEVDLVLAEKRIMQRTNDHPFVIKLRAAWQDDNLIYFLQDFVQGGELFTIMLDKEAPYDEDELAPRKALPTKSVRFYAACLADALSYIHSNDIVYRDLKPENVLIDDAGYVRLIDLGAAKELKAENDYKSYTLIGTPRYIAPEQIEGKGHSYEVDHWALGILIYEMLTGLHPFDEWEGSDEMALFSNVCEGDYLALPSGIPEKVQDWIDALLQTNPAERLGTEGQPDILSHAWLSKMDMVALRRKKIKAPWRPKLANHHDSSHFDEWDHLEPVIHSDTTIYPKLPKRAKDLFATFDDE